MAQKLKRIGAVLIASIMALALCLPAFASEADVNGLPSAADRGEVSISGLKEGDTVTFYQIVKANYDDEAGFTGYVAVKDASIPLFDAEGNALYPTADQAAALAADPTGLPSVAADAPAGSDGTVTQALAAGEWLAIVTPGATNTDTVYNPLVLSVYYTANGSKINGGDVTLGKDTVFTINGDQGYVKKSEVDIDKKIVTPEEGRTDVANEHGDDLAIGDTINFEISSLIPAYSAEYQSVVYRITDEMDNSLDLDGNSIVVTVGGTEVEAAADTFEVTPGAHGFVINFNSDYVLGMGEATDAQRKVVVTYSASLNSSATVNFDENNTKATVEFTNSPDESAEPVKKEKETHQYTFEIDGAINGSSATINRKGHELIKVDENGAPQNIGWVNDGVVETEVTTGLAGAKFTLTYVRDADGNEIAQGDTRRRVYNATTDSNGYFNGFTGLDAGTYILKESEAPQNYTLDPTEHTVVISAQYNEEGYLVSFTILIDGEATSTYKATYVDGEVTEITTEGEPETTFIKNVKLNTLPSTGGTGTYILTIIGVAVFALAARLAIAGRKKTQ